MQGDRWDNGGKAATNDRGGQRAAILCQCNGYVGPIRPFMAG